MRKFAVAITGVALTVGYAGAWTTPVNLGANVNSSSSDGDPALGASNLTLYFSGNRSGGSGGWDIWYSNYSGGNWQPATNIGTNINTSNTEAEPGCTNLHTPSFTSAVIAPAARGTRTYG